MTDASCVSSITTISVMEQARSTPWSDCVPRSHPQLRQILEDFFRLRAIHYGTLHTCPLFASISSEAFGPHVPAA